MTNEERAFHWTNNESNLRDFGIDPEKLGTMIHMRDTGGYGKVAGLNPRSKRPVQITFKRNGQARVLSMTLERFRDVYCK